MDPTFEEALGLDLNYIPPPVQNIVNEKELIKELQHFKKKLVKVKPLIIKLKVISIKNKELERDNEQFKRDNEELKTMVSMSKAECKKVCIDYKNKLEQLTAAEKCIRVRDTIIKTQEETITQSRNETEAWKSSNYQLEAKNNELLLVIDALKAKDQIEEKKKGKRNVDVAEKSWISISKKYKTAVSHNHIFVDIILGKRKVQTAEKRLIRKYQKSDQESDVCRDGSYISLVDDCLLPAFDKEFKKPHQYQNSQTKTYNVVKGNINDRLASNGNNGVQEFEHDCEDTGRGSPLAISDPDYNIHDSSHIETEQNNIKAKKFADASTNTSFNVDEEATSLPMFDDAPIGFPIQDDERIHTASIPKEFPIQGNERIDIASSPIGFPIQANERIDTASSPIDFPIQGNERIDTASSPIGFLIQANERIDTASSPIEFPIQGNERIDTASSPIGFLIQANERIDTASSPIEFPIQGNERIDTASSPIGFPIQDDEIIHKASIPIEFPIQGNEGIDTASSPIGFPIRDDERIHTASVPIEFPIQGNERIDTASSPIGFPIQANKRIDTASSPIEFPIEGNERIDTALNPIGFPIQDDERIHTASVPIEFPIQGNERIDTASSPIGFPIQANKRIDTASSPIEFPIQGNERIDTALNPIGFPIQDDERIHTASIPIEFPIQGNERIHTASTPIGFPIQDVKRKDTISIPIEFPIQDVERILTDSSPIGFVNSDLLNGNTTKHSQKSINPLNNKIGEHNIQNTQDIETNTANEIIQNTSLNTDISNHSIPEILSMETFVSQNSTSVCVEICDEICDTNVLEKICLEEHNSDNLTDNCNIDTEVAMILSKMQNLDRILTPIPITPTKSREKANERESTPIPHTPTKSREKANERESTPIPYTPTESRKKANQRESISCQQRISICECPCIQTPANITLTEIPEYIQLTENVKQLSNEMIKVKAQLEKIKDSSHDTLKSNNKNRIAQDVEKLDRNIASNIDENIDTECIQYQHTDKLCALNNNNNNNINLVNKSQSLQINDNDNLPISQLNPEDYSISNSCRKILFEKGNNYSIDNKNNESHEKIKTKKNNRNLSKLDKLRHKMLPKYKIAENINTISRKKIKPIAVIRNKNDKIYENNIAYENAVRIMAEEKKKKNDILLTSESINNNKEIQYVNNNSDHSKLNLQSNQKKFEENVGRRDDEINKQLESKQPLENNETPKTKSNMRTTRSKSKLFDHSGTSTVLSPEKLSNDHNKEVDNLKKVFNDIERSPGSRKLLKRLADEDIDVRQAVAAKRFLRSSKAIEPNIEYTTNESNHITSNNINSNISKEMNVTKIIIDSPNKRDTNETNRKRAIVSYKSDLFSSTEKYDTSDSYDSQAKLSHHYPKNSILCKSIDKYAKLKYKYSSKKVPEHVINNINQKLEKDLGRIIKLPEDKIKPEMNKLLCDIQRVDIKIFILGLIKYIKKSTKTHEMWKTKGSQVPPLTKVDQILLYVFKELKNEHFIDMVLKNIEYSLLHLNIKSQHDTTIQDIASLSHFYAVICKYFKMKKRLRIFILDAMYSLSYGGVIVVKQCLDVWPHLLPLAHMGIAKTLLVMCFVYMLHSYKSKLNSKIVTALRFMLYKKYFYPTGEWTETNMLEILKNALLEFKDTSLYKKTLRLSLILLAKRQGVQWCHHNIIKNMLLPIIENDEASDVLKRFAISMLGPLLKPYPASMAVNSEIVANKLLNMLKNNPPNAMKEVLFTSLIVISKNNKFVIKALYYWEPKKVSLEFGQTLINFVQEKPRNKWVRLIKSILSDPEDE